MVDRVKIGLNAGHGGLSVGTRYARDGMYESMLNLDLAIHATALLGWSETVEPVLIRQGDYDLKHAECNRIAERAGCVAIVDIHHNWCDWDKSRWGGEVYHREGDVEGRALGSHIFAELLGREWRTWKSNYRTREGNLGSPGAFSITYAYSMPCALIEVAFLSNVGDREWLKLPETPDKIAIAIKLGCEAWAQAQRMSHAY